MMRAEEIIIRPWVTEKTTHLREKFNKYAFIVDKRADKISIARAISDLFNVKPVKVNVMNVKGKLKRVRYKYGYTPSLKKCIITLKEGDKIAIFEGA
ncbi:MAG: 50S ribosomal protein L23 [Spirochaetes bacterium GWD1_27_9]|nr:MAG: 50S ribosomal protein L23 [Spirochaetes bacterium GWB1_27_13]OHD21022.1 MAG: 50S ribosomal protein L23 [Spirochaetes bacterium GWC1_27_15]OHD45383.1 MAG: 50S ribosomal protein L23 [Spirochaetes bacterium GWD1_27_9]